MPFSIDEKMVVIMPANQMMASSGLTFQKAYTWRGDAIKSPTAWMMTALRAAFGIP